MGKYPKHNTEQKKKIQLAGKKSYKMITIYVIFQR